MNGGSNITLSNSEINGLRRVGSGLGNLLSISDRDLFVAMRLISRAPTGRLILTQAGMQQIAENDAGRHPSSGGTASYSGRPEPKRVERQSRLGSAGCD
jgi:hypothetical protein